MGHNILLTYSLLICCYYGIMIDAAPIGKANRNRKYGQAFKGEVNVIGSIPEIKDIYEGRSTVRDLSWLQINNIVVKMLRELDNMWLELEETQDNIESYSTNYIIPVSILAVGCATALLLVCLHFARLRSALTRLRKGIPMNFEYARKNLQDLLKLRKLSVGDLEPSVSKNNQNLPYPSFPNMGTAYFANPAFNVPNLPYPNPLFGHTGAQTTSAQPMPAASAPTGANPMPST